MDREKLFDSLDGLYAYDCGCINSGIYDELLRYEIKEYLTSLDSNTFRIITTEFVREYFVCEKAVKQGYGIEDIKSFIDWLDDCMDISL